jgi:FkbM family methyltransferase
LITSSDGLRWYDDGPGTGDVLGPADHEAILEPTLRALLPVGGVLVDVGAHVGHWSIRLAGQASKVIAVEASPDTATRLWANITLNQITNIQAVQLAAWDRPARLTLHDSHGQVRGGGTRTLPSSHGHIQAGPLDTLLACEPRIDLIKIDVEGADLPTIRGLRHTTARLGPALFIECHDVLGYYKIADLHAGLDALGYTYRPGGQYVLDSYTTSYLIAEPAASLS